MRYKINYAFLRNMPDVIYGDWESADLDVRNRFGTSIMRTTDGEYVDVTGFLYGSLETVDGVESTFAYGTSVVIHEYIPQYKLDALGYPAKDAPNISGYNNMTGVVKRTYWFQGEEIAWVKLNIPPWGRQEPEWMCHNIAVSKLKVYTTEK
jgi:hypothetical protein